MAKSDAVRAWVGPKGADQDFQTHNAAWEVKTIHPGATSVTISSESQSNYVSNSDSGRN
ncbi:MAG: PD-(D/E)XK motif protein [Betaproteobacteria bacterium]|nr:PD-(D/E)XK motif protein [Betaproteobacteria bacterium]